MGYRLMIPQYQYKQYQERMIKVESNPIHITPIKRAENERRMEQPIDRQFGMSRHVRKIDTYLTARITGKGNVINEYI